MQRVSYDSHIVQFFGACTTTEPAMLVMEYMRVSADATAQRLPLLMLFLLIGSPTAVGAATARPVLNVPCRRIFRPVVHHLAGKWP